MTGATPSGKALPAMSFDIAIEGSLKEAIFHITKQQCELNDMFKDVISDFQVRLLENQSKVIELQTSICKRIDNVEANMCEMVKTYRMNQKILKVIAERLSSIAERLSEDIHKGGKI